MQPLTIHVKKKKLKKKIEKWKNFREISTKSDKKQIWLKWKTDSSFSAPPHTQKMKIISCSWEIIVRQVREVPEKWFGMTKVFVHKKESKTYLIKHKGKQQKAAPNHSKHNFSER